MFEQKEVSANTTQTKKAQPKEGDVFFLTLEEHQDPKNSKKIAHKSISPKYDKDGLIGYNIGGYTPGYIKHLAAEKKKKKQAN